LLVSIPGVGYAICNEQKLTVTSYTTKPNLEANKIYQVVLAAYGEGYSVLTSEGKKQLIPSDFYRRIPLQVPKNIKAHANPTSIEISFDKTDHAEGYDVRFDNNVYSVTGWGARITKTIYNLKPQTSHTYAVRSKDSIKTSEYSATQTVITPAIKPSVPHTTKKTVTENSATISWAAVSGATSYDVRLNGSVQNVTGTSKTFTGLSPAAEYTYQIRARTAGGVGDYGPEQTFRTPPGAPAGAKASSQEDSVTINWNVARGADSYDVLCNGKVYHAAKPPVTIGGLSPNTSYSYKVRSNNADGSSSYSAEKKIKTSPMPPEASKVKATASKNSVTISWGKVAGANSYDVRFDNSIYHVSGTSKVFSGLSSGKSYAYAVSARNSDGSSTFTDVKTITTTPEIPPVPQNVKVEVSAESAVVSWDGVSRADGYEVKFGDKVYETTSTSLTITGLLPDKSYSCTVRAKNAGGSSAYTASKSVRTLKKVPAVPSGVAASATGNSVTVSWNTVSGASSYDVLFNNTTYRVTSGTSRTIMGLNSGTSYTYCVRANNTAGSSPYSIAQTIATTPNAPKVPANISASATENSVTVKWTASAGASGYDVKLGGKIYNVTGTSTTVSGLSADTNYTYCVQAKNAGGVSGYSPSKTVRTLLKVPANVTASAETNSVTISWSSVSGASGYEVLLNNQTYSVT
ncbi:MAG: fibronectin type III domain-containing protein, partial [Lachnospiraceae bacterium]|nr:fibronectin type III domain-containing protein [Lachnospiraceae bacterium]